jgi:ribosome maturation factor RimP
MLLPVVLPPRAVSVESDPCYHVSAVKRSKDAVLMTWACAHVFNFLALEGPRKRRDDAPKGADVDGTRALEAALAPACAAVGVELADVELTGSTLLVTIERDTPLNLDEVAHVATVVSELLDGDEEIAPSGHYQLEVSTPGLERRLRRPEHFRRVIGKTVAVRTLPGGDGPRRIEGVLAAAGEESFTVTFEGATHEVAYVAVERAKTVFDWQSALHAASSTEAGRSANGRATKKTTTAREAR